MAAGLGLAEDQFLDKAVEVYREYAKAASVSKARVSLFEQDSNSNTVEISIDSQWSQRDLERNENRSFLRNYIASYNTTSLSLSNIREPSFPLVRSMAKFLKMKLICMFIGQFGSLVWSASEKYLLYVAEKKLPKAVSYFEKQKGDAAADKPPPEKGNKFEFKDDWGEQLVSKCSPVIVVYDMESDEIRVLEGVPDNLSAGQVRWGPNDDSVVFVGWLHEPYRLGLIYCPIRKNALYSLSLDGKSLEQLTDPKYAVHSPRFNHTKDKLIYIALDVGGAHLKCGRLMQYDWIAKTTSTIVDVVDIPEKGGFPGIYNLYLTLADRCWTPDGNSVILSTVWRTSQKIVLINCKDKTVTNLTSASHSSPNSPPKLMVATLPPDIPEPGLSWIEVAHSEILNLENEISWKVMTLAPSENADFKDEYEAVFIKPGLKDETKPPLIVFPHGGPHSAFLSDFSLSSACLCKLGFAILGVNFRGSIGFGETQLHSLPGNIGIQDVQDVQRAALKVLGSGEVDTSNVFIMGGSHGGFLTTHLIGQCFFENGEEFRHDAVLDGHTLVKMLEESPFSLIKKVKTPILIMLGEDDLRVPPSQGRKYYKVLKAQGTKTRLLSYPDNNHPISKVEAESDSFINMARWFFEHLLK
ncbi:hypothetical protein pdam_00010942 [Pocillopora damicornis]|uniref:Acylamino-acid-releasing enzyme n=1 Tax=Pocillopora damicornis TaxID=46731 RepID=A0A3M6UH01_POCDA|nr:hypothetical protein pdam_00010942 [Pocillopora damicornis]